MYESPEYYENQINELVFRLNLAEKKLADVRRRMEEVQEKLDSAFILAFGNPFEEIMEEVADALAGCGVAVKRHDEDDNDLRDIFFFDGTSLWSGNEDDLYLLHAGRLNGDAVDANDWFISYYGPDEDGADEHWDELEKNWNNVKKDLAYFRLSDYVRLCLNMEN